MSEGPLPGPRLLLVEDEEVLRGLVSQFLRLESYEVTAAEDGRAAVDAYLAQGPFDVVLLDLNLPDFSGVEVCRQIKRINARQPFLVCSAAILDSHRLALEDLGVTETLGKPHHPRELLRRLEGVLSARAEAAVDGDRRRIHAPHGGPSPTRALSETRSFD